MVATLMDRIHRGVLPLAAAIVSGVLYFTSFPPLEWTVLGFVAWVPLMIAIHAHRSRECATQALGGLGLGVFFGMLAFSVDPPEVVTGAAWTGVSIAVGLVFGLVGGLVAVPMCTRRAHAMLGGCGFVWLPAVAWAGIEYLRLVTTMGHPWGMTATAHIDVAPLRVFLPLAGMWPVTIIVIATNGAVAALILKACGLWRGSSGVLSWSVAAVAAMWVIGGVLALLPTSEPDTSLRVAAVQPGEHVPDHQVTRPLIMRRQYDVLTEAITLLHVPATEEASAQGASLVVWPEASGWVDPNSIAHQALTLQVSDLAIRTGTTIVWPYFIRIDADHTRNEAVLVRSNGEISPPTTKDHPVWVIGERSITADLHPVYQLGETVVGLALGPDGTYTDTLARLARDGAQVVAVPTHDWRAYAGTQLAHLRVRAAEHRVAVVKADWRYGSAVIAPSGAIVVATADDERWPAMLVADVGLSEPGTPYTAAGDWLGLLCLLVTVGTAGGSAIATCRQTLQSRLASDGKELRQPHP